MLNPSDLFFFLFFSFYKKKNSVSILIFCEFLFPKNQQTVKRLISDSMRLSLREWRKQLVYFKRKNFQQIQKVRGIVNTIAFFCVWGYSGYYIASRAAKTEKETGIPHSVQFARITGEKFITKYNLNTGEEEKIDVLKVFADKEAEERRNLLEQRRLREKSSPTV